MLIARSNVALQLGVVGLGCQRTRRIASCSACQWINAITFSVRAGNFSANRSN